jgi:hypothetical protein
MPYSEQQLYSILPVGFVAAPAVHLGAEYEIDIGVLEESRRKPVAPLSGQTLSSQLVSSDSTAVAPSPTLTIETDLSDQDEFEVRVYDVRHGRRLVAAIELVSPRNKDRPESRHAFVGKVVALLQDDICVSIVDLVTIRQFSLYAEFFVVPIVARMACFAKDRQDAIRQSLQHSWRFPQGV